MLYTKIRHAETIRTLYRLRNVLAHEYHPEIGSKLGFAKFSGHYYRLMKKLQEEKILDSEGRFVETTTNSWLVELPTIVEPVILKILGNRIPFLIYLAFTIGWSTSSGRIIKELFLTRSSTHNALTKLGMHNLIEKTDSDFLVRGEPFHRWLRRYLQLCKTQADIKNDIAILFDTVPAYVDGDQAYYLLNYEPGRPIGPANMIIKTHEPFFSFWKSAINEIRYFKEYPKNVQLEVITKNEKILWLNGIPYNKNAKTRFERS